MKTTVNAGVSNSHRLPLLALVVATASLFAFAPESDRAGTQVPFKAKFDTTFESVLQFPFLYVTVTGQGNATHLGKTTAVSTDEIINLIDGSATATFTLTGANGDTVILATAFQVTQTQDGVTFVGTYTVSGGTGRFAGATGDGSVAGSATFTGPSNGIGAFTVNGTISSPGAM